MKPLPNDIVNFAFSNWFSRDEHGYLYVTTRDGQTFRVVVGVGLDLIPMEEED